jgi:hypothetical protein
MLPLRDHLHKLALAAISFVLFAASFHFNEVFDKLMLFAPGISLIFVPAGVKLLCVLVGGEAAAVGLFAASIYLSLAIWQNLPPIATVYFGLIAVGTYFSAVYAVKRYFKIKDDLSNLRYWHIVILSVAASLLNGFAHNVVYMLQGVTQGDEFFSKSWAMAFGDFLGCFAVVMLFNMGINAVRFLAPRLSKST